MRAIFHTAIALLGLTCLAPAQDPAAEYDREFQRGLQALTAGKHDEGIAAFERCLELRPRDPVSAYNIACGQALKGETDQAFQWLDKSAEWGFGNAEPNIQHAQQDEDLASLRSDPRFQRFIDRMTALRAKVQAFLKEAAIFVPKALEKADEVGVLVVMHPHGETKLDVVRGHWRAVAEELGLVLIAPSGLHAIEGEPEKGMTFVRNLAEYTQRPWVDEKPVVDAVEAYRKTKKVDRTRIFLAGVGSSAAVAFNAAVSSPGLFRGVIVCDGPILPQLSSTKATNAAKMGLNVQVVLHEGAPTLPAGQELQALAANLRQRFQEWNLHHDMQLIPPADYRPDTFARTLSKAVQNLSEAVARPAEAGATPR